MAAATNSHTDFAFQSRSIDILIGNDFASHESLWPWPHAVRNAMRTPEEGKSPERRRKKKNGQVSLRG